MNITILGAGAWGTALAIALSARHKVVLWGRDAEMIQATGDRRENFRYLPGFVLPGSITLTADLDVAMRHQADAPPEQSLLIAATSVAGLREMSSQLLPYDVDHLVWLCKGFEEGSLQLPHRIVSETLGGKVALAALSGPSFAQEVAQGLPCALVSATADKRLCERIVAGTHGGNIRVYSSNDMIGVEVGGAVKNILAIATGVADGLGLGLNARAALINRGLVEITRLGTALGGRPETFMGLAGMGDLILTCTGDLSRNRRVGLGLAQGKSLDAIVTELGHVAEGVRCAQTVRSLAAEHGVEMPIAGAVAAVLFDGDKPRDMVDRLLARSPCEERW